MFAASSWEAPCERTAAVFFFPISGAQNHKLPRQARDKREKRFKEKDLFFRTATRLPLVAGHRSLSVREPISGHRAIDSLKCCKCFPATVWSVAWQKPHSLREPKPTDHSGPLLCVPERDGTAAVGAVAPRRLEVSAQNTGVVGKNFAVCPYNARMCGQKTLLRFPPLS